MFIKEKYNGITYLMPLKGFDNIFRKDLSNLKIFLLSFNVYKTMSKTHEDVFKKLITAIDNIDSYTYPLFIYDTKDILLIIDLFEILISEKINRMFGKINKKDIKNGISFLKSIL